MNMTPYLHRRGFTLIEISIVLTLIALVLGGVLIGRNILEASLINGTVAQHKKYNTAVNTFLYKYGALPGDISNPGDFGFASTFQGMYEGRGNNNGRIHTFYADCVLDIAGGETNIFWTHLAQAGLIDEQTTRIDFYGCDGDLYKMDDTILPAAKLGRGNRFVVWSAQNGPNRFAISAMTALNTFDGTYDGETKQITPQEAFELDTKMDDGIPTTGGVQSILTVNYPWFSTNGHASPVAGTHCHDSDNPPSYSRSTEAHASTPSCALQLPADF